METGTSISRQSGRSQWMETPIDAAMRSMRSSGNELKFLDAEAVKKDPPGRIVPGLDGYIQFCIGTGILNAWTTAW
jgi:hypothetical protein